ncbi:PREDICTED: cadherin-23-like [Calidris pugnax]|uniref:cadherin-23-like n=1 Tax=Calidris pugnax TaxID=198806 RepID=UPI00071D3E7A|nr:PREDICTED: cadherin-23-like [Calidris pugnax]
MKRHTSAGSFLLPLLLLELVSLGRGNRLPYFMNYFFDTYLLINEDTPVGSSVTQLLARDLDNDPLVFGVVGEEASRFFAVESMTGVVWLRQPLDRETKSEFTVEFSVSDSQGVIKGTVNIQVGDVNDNAPQFHNQPYSVRIPEVGIIAAASPGSLPSGSSLSGHTYCLVATTELDARLAEGHQKLRDCPPTLTVLGGRIKPLEVVV